MDKGDRFVDFIKGIRSPAIDPAIGGFSAAIDVEALGMRHPVLLTTTDGVGTKILVARRLGKLDTLGIDLVAMCVNDLVVCGARPVQFLDYIACGRIQEDRLAALMTGIVRGCELAGCRLGGGETAEMPDVYGPDEFDLAGFAVGAAERDDLLPRLDDIRAGDLVLGIASSGIHSNGFSLARKVLPVESWGDLLPPTRIYAAEMAALCATGGVLAAAHVTGSGLAGNLGRVIPDGLRAAFSFDWPLPPVFRRIQQLGGVSDGEMRGVFNLGIGIALVAHPHSLSALDAAARGAGFSLLRIGTLERG
ncbi:MAG: phosphoribosylformylglycinamidine cyclo-ligase [Spirochaetes bacterium RBG_13_68_11]|nr:MAG: phosphoribosylformylglycinamidine cyclo-ligase [Spirochaetes bacterium RBG_13_68_11]